MSAPNVRETNIGPLTLLETLDADLQSIASYVPLEVKLASAGAVIPLSKVDYYKTFGNDNYGELQEISGLELEAVYLGMKHIKGRYVPESRQVLLKLKGIGNVAGFEFHKVFELEHSRQLNIPGGILKSMSLTTNEHFADYPEPINSLEIALAAAAIKDEFVPKVLSLTPHPYTS